MIVKFKIFKGEILAIFPEDYYFDDSGNKLLTCYAHQGQHSVCSVDLLKCRNAKPEQYLKLKEELISIGYEVNDD